MQNAKTIRDDYDKGYEVRVKAQDPRHRSASK